MKEKENIGEWNWRGKEKGEKKGREKVLTEDKEKTLEKKKCD